VLARVRDLVAENLGDGLRIERRAGGIAKPDFTTKTVVRRRNERGDVPAQRPQHGERRANGGSRVPDAVHPGGVGMDPRPVVGGAAPGESGEDDVGRYEVRLDEMVNRLPYGPVLGPTAGVEGAAR
jgi:hypothetical protein